MTEYGLLNMSTREGAAFRETWKTIIGTEYATNDENGLGLLRWTDDGRCFRWMRAETAFSQGMIASSTSCDVLGDGYGYDGTVTTAQASGTNELADSTGWPTEYTGDIYGPGWFVATNGDTVAHGQGQIHQIEKAVSTTKVRITGTWAVGLTTAADFLFFSPYSVIPATVSAAGVGPVVMGVAQHAITDEYYAWFQVYGPGVVLLDASEAAPVLGQPIYVSSAGSNAGKAKGPITASTTLSATVLAFFNERLSKPVGWGLYDATEAVDALMYIFINCL